MRRVFDGGEGETKDGTVEISRERGLSVASIIGVDAAEDGGDALGFDMFAFGLRAEIQSPRPQNSAHFTQQCRCM